MYKLKQVSLEFHNQFSKCGIRHYNKQDLKVENIDIATKPKLIPKGCKVYLIEKTEIIALNEKSAMKKYLKNHIVKSNEMINDKIK